MTPERHLVGLAGRCNAGALRILGPVADQAREDAQVAARPMGSADGIRIRRLSIEHW